MKKVETVDLSHLSGSPNREFLRGYRHGEEIGALRVYVSSEGGVYGVVGGWDIGAARFLSGKERRKFWRYYGLKKVPARLTRGLLRLGASVVLMRELETAYAEILAAVAEVRHEDLHTDTSGAEY